MSRRASGWSRDQPRSSVPPPTAARYRSASCVASPVISVLTAHPTTSRPNTTTATNVRRLPGPLIGPCSLHPREGSGSDRVAGSGDRIGAHRLSLVGDATWATRLSVHDFLGCDHARILVGTGEAHEEVVVVSRAATKAR